MKTKQGKWRLGQIQLRLVIQSFKNCLLIALRKQKRKGHDPVLGFQHSRILPTRCISCILKAPRLNLCSWLLSAYFALSQHLPVFQNHLCWRDLPPSLQTLARTLWLFTCHSSRVTSACQNWIASLFCADSSLAKPVHLHPVTKG